ncbi:E3 ubiquitin ligase [Moesziomyces antarcticus T-34]|uniref:RING-type E3 ubiquitin transferase n=1 Tax=Pseudozyma antarctica (strain T-34) TaxID=1151754 RepID=M9MCR9_PSEA3|nr:E3 ubiquitin ligase [Moesziomyces antarcticus T-34]
MPPNPYMPWLTRPRMYAYGIVSTLVAVATVGTAFSERSNFYAAVVFLGRSNGCMLVLLNFLLVIALIAGRTLQLMYFGQLRRSEVELIGERSWYSLVGTLLAVSIFRDDFSVSFVILFGVLLFLKIFHWLSAERVASIMQSPSVPRIFHVRMVSILTTLLLADLLLVAFSLQMLIVKKIKIGMMVLFTSEFIILTALLFNTIAQYILNCIDMAREEPWEAKSLYVLYVDLAHDVVRLGTHTYFFILLTRLYGIPLSLIHDLYSAGRSCTTKVKALFRYRQALKKMETKYPNASAADLQATDGTCIICREDMVAAEASEATPPNSPAAVTNVTPKKLSCGHIFHFRCLRSWLERQQSCPTCRRMILDDEPEPAASPAQQQQPPPPPHGAVGVPDDNGSGLDPSDRATNRAGPSGAGLASTAAHGQGTAAEEEYDTRLQGFLQRLQSDLRKVRDEGNLSAQRASNRAASRSGRSTPRTAAWSPDAVFGGSTSGGVGIARHVPAVSSLAQADEGLGGLWMPPPPSTLYRTCRRPVLPTRTKVAEAEASQEDSKGKGKERQPEADAVVQDDAAEDPIDPREAIRQATLRRFGQSANVTSTSATATATGSSERTATSTGTAGVEHSPLAMIPLFDPRAIADYDAAHASSLPHPLVVHPHTAGTASTSAGGSDAVVGAGTAVQDQIAALRAIQARIDSVIADLARIAPSALSPPNADESSPS